MSIVSDVVQRIVLHGAYELTCAAAVRVFKRCQSLEHSKGGKCEAVEEQEAEVVEDSPAAAISIHLPEPPPDPKVKEVEVMRPVSQLDVTFKNSGPICPPKTSCMRLARNSYFS